MIVFKKPIWLFCGAVPGIGALAFPLAQRSRLLEPRQAQTLGLDGCPAGAASIRAINYIIQSDARPIK
jgi:hypothetical protein